MAGVKTGKGAPRGKRVRGKPNTVKVTLTGTGNGYPDEVWDEFLGRIAMGETITYLHTLGFPSRDAVYKRRMADPEFGRRLDQAKLDGVLARAEEIIEITNSVPEDPNAIAKAKLRADVRKWEASKLLFQVYGDKQQVDLKAEVSVVDAIKEAYRRRVEGAESKPVED